MFFYLYLQNAPLLHRLQTPKSSEYQKSLNQHINQ
ncbi:thioredoxin [Listeria monocytogenes]|nr:thioredoxin [Listeria monocytogenes]